MKQWVAAMVMVAMPAMAAAPGTVDLAGTWSINGDVSGVQVTETCTVVQQEGALTGSCDTSTGKYDLKGKVDGRTATFSHGGKYQGSDLVITFTGKVADDGSMTGSIDVDPFNATGSFSAKKGDAARPQS